MNDELCRIKDKNSLKSNDANCNVMKKSQVPSCPNPGNISFGNLGLKEPQFR